MRRLEQFIAAAGSRYAKARNFDFGPERRGNVSKLSPYIRHRLILEDEVLASVLSQHSPSEADKFVQEIFWRAYYKGWLEQRPSVWQTYRGDLARLVQTLDSDSDSLARYNDAVEGRTGIDCFDAWANELVATGYLHNHARMWFASIWIYTLELPWQLGADFFYRHLLDGDPASNTLSWRWICGLHTPGKTYLARASNIARYTDNRFNPRGQLAAKAPALTESHVHPTRPLPAADDMPREGRFGLLVTEEDVGPDSLLENRSPVAILGAIATQMRSPLEVGDSAGDFAAGAISDGISRMANALGVSGELSDAQDWGVLLADWAARHRLATIVTAHAPVGPVADQLHAARDELDRHGIRLVQRRRPYDSATWPHARRGYFKLRKQIPSILERLGLAPDLGQIDSKVG
jgi:deoxyribodipyrimidine photo-lyase